jgi:hypothetical protein
MLQTPLKNQTFLDGEKSSDEEVFSALARAEDRVSRLDECARSSGFVEGWRARADLRAVIAAMAIDGVLVHPEDLILRAAEADARLPDQSLTRAHAVLRSRQRAGDGGAELLSWQGISWLVGLTRHAPPPGPRPTIRVGEPADGGAYAALERFFEALIGGESGTPRMGVEECLGVLDLEVRLPPLLQAAALLEAWRIVDPLPAQRSAAAIAAAMVLKVSRRFTASLFPLEIGVRRRAMAPRLAWAPLAQRLAYWLGAMELAAELELEEIIRLRHKKALLERKATEGRRHGKALAFAALAVEQPVLTSELIARSLGVTPQGGLQLVKRFGGALQEITGRSRYRVWRL